MLLEDYRQPLVVQGQTDRQVEESIKQNLKLVIERKNFKLEQKKPDEEENTENERPKEIMNGKKTKRKSQKKRAQKKTSNE